MDTPSSGTLEVTRIRVWDGFVRVFHWSVAGAFFLAYITEDEMLTVHVWAGYAVGALVLMRIVWGFVGPQHARFTDFVCGPWTALRYLRDLTAGRAARHLGHSPAGGAMVLLLLAGLLATVWSGLEVHAIENDAGPLAAASDGPRPSAARAWIADARANGAEDRRERGEREDELWEELHEALANAVLVLVVLHVLGVLLASAVHRENLTAAMITGMKRER